MSYATAKGYRGEADVRGFFAARGVTLIRPRTTSYAATDIGDLAGLPLVMSVKNHATLNLSGWCDEMAAMVERSPWDTGVVIHKRRGHPPRRMYVTTTLEYAAPLLMSYEICVAKGGVL